MSPIERALIAGAVALVVVSAAGVLLGVPRTTAFLVAVLVGLVVVAVMGARL